MAPIIRPARAEELQTAQQLVVRSLNDLTERHGFGKFASVRSPDFQLFSLREDPDGLWVAEANGEIVGFVFSWVAADFWFLAQLFVSPASQGDGVGSALLDRAFEHARKSGASNRALITFAFNVVSTGLYIKYGLLPRLPIYVVQADRAALKQPSTHGKLRVVDIADSSAHGELLARLDGAALGFPRERHHVFLRAQSSVRGVLLYRGENCIGYAYINAAGHIGPLAVAQRENMGDVFATALDIAAACDAPQVSAFVPGVCKAALDIAGASGMRLAMPTMLMSAEPFGDWQCYLPTNPGFM